MKFFIEKGKHQSTPWAPNFIKPGTIKKKIFFNNSNIYELEGEDQLDWNKLFGVTFGIFPTIVNGKIYRPTHYSSVRFGWRYNPKYKVFEITPYYYVAGVRHYHEIDKSPICALLPYKLYDFYIISSYTDVVFKINDSNGNNLYYYKVPCQYGFTPKTGWQLNPFFGGNKPSPHDQCIELS